MALAITQPMFADNFIDLGTATVSSEDTVNDHGKEKAIDNDRITYWESDGSDDLTQETYLITLSVAKDVDFFYLYGINFKQFKIQYWGGASYVDIADTIKTAWTDSYYVVRLSAPVNSDRFRIVIDTTQSADAEKKMNEFLIGCHYLSVWYDVFKKRDIEKAGVHRTALGKADSWQEWKKEGWNIGLKNISLADVAIIDTIKDAYEDFIWFPEPSLYPDRVFLVEWTNPNSRSYTSQFKGAGSTIQMKLEEK